MVQESRFLQLGERTKVADGRLTLLSINSYNVVIHIETPWGESIGNRTFSTGTALPFRSSTGELYIVQLTKIDISPKFPPLAGVLCTYTPAPVAQEGKISCSSTPSGADIYYDNKLQSAKTPIVLTGISPGIHTIRLSLSGYKDYIKDVGVTAGQTANVSATLEAVSQNTTLTLNQPTKTTITEGENLTLSGNLRDESGSGITGVEVRFYDADLTTDDPLKDASGSDLKATTGPNGVFMVNWPAANMDAEYGLSRANVVAKFAGTTAYKASKSSEYLITIIKKEPDPTTLTVTVSPTSAQVGDTIKISGYLKTATGTPISGATIKLYDNDSPLGKQELKNLSTPLVATTNSSGYFSINWLSEKMDSWDWTTEVIAVYEGSATYKASQSAEAVVTLKERELIATSLTVNLDAPTVGGTATVSEGDKVTISGKLTDASGKAVSYASIRLFDYDLGSGDDQLEENGTPLVARTDANGNYSASWTAQKMDKLVPEVQIYAQFDGDANYAQSKSGKKTLFIRGATAPFQVTSAPTGATIYVNGKSTGKKTPATLELEYGSYELTGRFERPWYIPESYDVPEGAKIPDKTITIEVKLDQSKNSAALDFIEPSVLCKLLGATTITECQTTVSVGIWDLIFDLNSFTKIIMKQDMYTGQPATADGIDYFCAALALFPVVGTGFKTIGKVGLNIAEHGHRLIKVIEHEKEVAEILNRTLFFNRAVGMTAEEINQVNTLASKVLDSAVGSNARRIALNNLEDFIKRFPAVEIPNTMITKVQSELAKIMDGTNADKVLEFMYKLGKVSTEFGQKYATLFDEFLAGSRVLKLDELEELARHAVDKPDEALDLIESIGLATTASVGKKFRLTTVYGSTAQAMLDRWIAVSNAKGSMKITAEVANTRVAEAAKTALEAISKSMHNTNINDAINLMNTKHSDALYDIDKLVANEYLEYLSKLFASTPADTWATNAVTASVKKADVVLTKVETAPRTYAAVIKNGDNVVTKVAKDSDEVATLVRNSADVDKIQSSSTVLAKIDEVIKNSANLDNVLDPELAAIGRMSKIFKDMPSSEAMQALDATEDLMKFATKDVTAALRDSNGVLVGRLNSQSTYRDTLKTLADKIDSAATSTRPLIKIKEAAGSKVDDLLDAKKYLEDMGKHVPDDDFYKMDNFAKNLVPRAAVDIGSKAAEYVKFFDDMLDKADLVVTKNTLDDFLDNIIADPAFIYEVLSTLGSSKMIKIKELVLKNGNIGTTFRDTLRIFGNMLDEGVPHLEIANEFTISTAKAIKHYASDSNPNGLLDLFNVMFDPKNKLYDMGDISKSRYFTDVYMTVNDLSKTNPSYWTRKISDFVAKRITSIANFIRGHPVGAGLTIWFFLDNVPFYNWVVAKIFGVDPGTPEYVMGELTRSMNNLARDAKDACDSGMTDVYGSLLEVLESTYDEYVIHINRTRTNLELSTRWDYAVGMQKYYGAVIQTLKEKCSKCNPLDQGIIQGNEILDVRIDEITDGDTIVGHFPNGATKNIRLLGVNTPEKPDTSTGGLSEVEYMTEEGASRLMYVKKELYQEATVQIGKLLGKRTVTLKVNAERLEDGYCRVLATVINDEGIDANKELIKIGLGAYFHRSSWSSENDPFDHDEYKALQKAAQDAKIGIWAGDADAVNTGKVIFTASRKTATGGQTSASAAVFMNDEYLGMTSPSDPYDIPEGIHHIKAESAIYGTGETEIEVTHGSMQTVNIPLTTEGDPDNPDDPFEDPDDSDGDETTGIVDFATFRRKEDGSTVGTTTTVYEGDQYLYTVSSTKNGHKTTPGEHTYTIKKDGHVSATETIEVTAGQRHLVSVILEPSGGSGDPSNPGDDPTKSTGTLDVISKPASASIYIDEKYVGLTKKTGIAVATGTRKITLRKSGYMDWSKTITIVEGKSHVVDAILEESDDLDTGTPYIPGTGTGYPTYIPGFEPKSTTTSSPASTGGGGGQTSEPGKEPWSELSGQVKISIMTLGEPSEKQEVIIEEVEKFLDKYSKLDIKLQKVNHPAIELEKDQDGNAALDKPKHIMERLKEEDIPDDSKILYLLWTPVGGREPAYDGTTNGIDEDVWGAVLCSSPNTGKEYPFNGVTGRLVNERLKVTYQGTITMLLQIMDALHEIYNVDRDDDAEDLPELDKEFCEKEYHDKRANARCIVAWLKKLNSSIPGLEEGK